MYALRWVLLIVLLTSGLTVDAQTYRFSKLTLEDGLPQNTVNTIFQDKEGFIWFGTQDGLCRFDGYDFKYYRSGKGELLSDGFVVHVEQDTLGRIWASTREGINVLNPINDSVFVLRYEDDGREYVGQSIRRIQGHMYLRFGSQYFQIPETIQPESAVTELHNGPYVFEKDTAFLDLMYSDHYGWIKLDRSGLILEGANKDTIRPQGNEEIWWSTGYGLFEGDEKDIWVLTGEEVYCYTSGAGFLNRIDFSAPQITPLDLELDDQGQVWIATTEGIFIWKGEHEPMQHLSAREGEAGGLSNDVVLDLFRDRQNNLWVGLSNKGLNLYKPQLDRFKYLNGFGSMDDMVWAIYQTDSVLWIGTENGLYRIELSNPRLTQTRFLAEAIKHQQKVAGIPERIMTLAKVGQELWAGARGGFYRINLEHPQEITQVLLPPVEYTGNRPVTAIENIGQEVWIATFYGIYIYSREGRWLRSIIHEAGPGKLDSRYILAMHSDQEHVWLGTNEGMSRIRLADGAIKNYHYQFSPENQRPSFRFISSFSPDADSALWLATFGGGIDRLDLQTDTICNYNVAAGLANAVVSGIMIDEPTGAWATHNQGLSYLKRGQDRVMNFGLSDGLIFQEAAISCIYQNEHREIAFGTPEGLVVFHPDSVLLPITSDLPVAITGLRINYKEQDSLLQVVQSQQSGGVELYPEDRVISFEFAALDFVNPEAVTYFFQLEGFDDEWATTKALNRRATYSNLPAGSYHFRVRAVNGRGQQSEEILRIPITVYPPIWQRPWFVFLALLIVVILGIRITVFFSQRKLKERLQELELEKKVRSERERISKDLHDNVGSNLTYLVNSLDNLSYRIETKKETLPGEKIDELSNSVRYTMEQLRESIWVLNKNRISLEDIQDKLTDFSSRMFSLQNIDYKVSITGDLRKEFKTGEAIQLFRIAQECIQNIVKHAQAKKVQIEIHYEDPNLVMEIQDDGIGFQPSGYLEGHYGLRNMQQRAEETGGRFSLKSEPGKGTQIFVEIPIYNN